MNSVGSRLGVSNRGPLRVVAEVGDGIVLGCDPGLDWILGVEWRGVGVGSDFGVRTWELSSCFEGVPLWNPFENGEW